MENEMLEKLFAEKGKIVTHIEYYQHRLSEINRKLKELVNKENPILQDEVKGDEKA